MTTLPVGPTYERELEPHERYVPGTHWRNAQDELEAAKLGMWLFLGTEVLLFGGFFCAYAVFRYWYPDNWHAASRHYLNWKIGAVNTAVLLLSSFNVVLAIRGAQMNRRWMIQVNLLMAWLCGLFFLVVKLWKEYFPKVQAGEMPGAFFRYAGSDGHAHAAEHAGALSRWFDAIFHVDHGAYVTQPYDHLFLSIYWVATATHGFHVLVGMLAFMWAMWLAWRGWYGPRHYTSLENIGLYWHLVDIIWIFLFPLLYLV